MRGRIFSSASSWIGSASSFSSIVTTVSSESSEYSSTFVTWPTSTPAIRTGERVDMFCASLKTALSSYGGFTNGMSFENPR